MAQKLNKYISGILAIALGFSPVLATKPKFSAEHPNPFYSAIWSQQRAMFSEADFNWDAYTFREYIDKIITRGITPPPGEKRQRAFQFFQRINDPLVSDAKSEVLSEEVPQDLNFYCGEGDKSICLASCIDKTVTEVGRLTLYTHLARPHKGMGCFAPLLKKQQIIRTFIDDTKLTQAVDAILQNMGASEAALLWMLTDVGFERGMKDYLYFKLWGMNKFNKNEYTLQARAIGEHAEQFMGLAFTSMGAILLPLGAVLMLTEDNSSKINDWAQNHYSIGGEVFRLLFNIFRNKYLQAGIMAGSGIACALRIPELCRWIPDSFFMEKRFHEIHVVAANYLNSLEMLHTAINQNQELTQLLPTYPYLENILVTLPQQICDLQKLFELLKTDTFKSKSSYVVFHGRVLAAYKLICELRTQLGTALLAVGEIDFYRSLAKLCQETSGAPFCFPEYLNADTPSIALEEFWNPFVPRAKAVTNSLCLGTHSQRRNALITGPNEGGKSTALKAIPLCLIMAQTLGIAPAKACVFTPFAKISTHLNITDDIGQGNSLFKSELLRAHNLLKTIQALGPQEFCFVAGDEMFNSTTPVEGAAAAFGVAKHIGEHPRSMCVLATHFAVLTRLEEITPNFTNYKVSVIIQPNGTITRPYKLEKGISHQHIALEALKLQGFADEIVATAQDLVAHQNT